MKIALRLDTLNESDTIKLTQDIKAGLTGNALFTPSPTLAALQTMLDSIDSAYVAISAAEVALRNAVNTKNAAFDTLRGGLNDEADTVQGAVDKLPAGQQLAAIESAGMTAATPATRLTSLPAVEALSISAGDAPTTMDWHCEPVPRKSFYVVEYTVGPVTPTSVWVPTPSSTGSSGTITGLPSGSSVSVRVHAAGTHGIVGAAAIAGPKIVP